METQKSKNILLAFASYLENKYATDMIDLLDENDKPCSKKLIDLIEEFIALNKTNDKTIKEQIVSTAN